MNTLLDTKNLPLLDLSGWSAAVSSQTRSSEGTKSMSLYLEKRQRLTQLLNKLAVQFNYNTAHETTPHQLMVDAQHHALSQEEDVPLDLSVKAETTPAHKNEYVCEACGQVFYVYDRLTKHIALRHKNRTPDAARVYECEICHRRFTRSDMLTRHARLHSGVKPYSCVACGQVFSRSDHLATHQRTHTGEKPYRCPLCPYAACRRDMITRHMKIHTRRPQPA